MIVQHVIQDTDTLQSIAQTYLNNPTRYFEIIDYNKLDYPYIVTDKNELEGFFASGYLRVNRASSINAVTLRAGSLFATNPTISESVVKTFIVVEDTVLPAGNPSPYVFVRSTVSGSAGNILSGAITQVVNVVTVGQLSIESITNETAFVSGRDVNVKVMGDVLFIPSETATTVLPNTVRTLLDYIEDLGQIDFILGSSTDWVFEVNNGGDINAVSGLDNMIQAISSRLMTERGEYPLHPEYGTNIPTLIGQPNLPYVRKLIELEILDALAYEDRIEEVNVSSVTVDGTSVYAEVTFKPAGLGTNVSWQTLRLTLDYRGGAVSV